MHVTVRLSSKIHSEGELLKEGIENESCKELFF